LFYERAPTHSESPVHAPNGSVIIARRGRGDLLFHLLTERENGCAGATASNEVFSRWAKIFTDPRLCAGVVGRTRVAP
jgi:hypothetical protein